MVLMLAAIKPISKIFKRISPILFLYALVCEVTLLMLDSSMKLLSAIRFQTSLEKGFSDWNIQKLFINLCDDIFETAFLVKVHTPWIFASGSYLSPTTLSEKFCDRKNNLSSVLFLDPASLRTYIMINSADGYI